MPTTQKALIPDKSLVLGDPHKIKTTSLNPVDWMIPKYGIYVDTFEVLPGGFAGILDSLARMKAGQVSGLKLVTRPQKI
ncbi:hypothetical protein CVT25_007293 [Psilocybe cyanescens]|uniref:Uncharacterized protein n=1 Tax=Psilocybe cyanescens TaxID=93625 RepID=A0A409XPE4_PSICY|nr:hypothetical protein CVT25_007293 [Psilocybe cyanescens]